MLKFWRNPLLILYVRSELRPARAAAAAAVTLVISILIGMGCWSADNGHAQDFFRHFYGWLVACQFVALGAWSAGTCGQAVSREREMKTFDFLKTTRLSAAEILVGKLLGAPIVAYFVVACTLPLSIVAGLLGGIGPAAVLCSALLLLAFNLFYSLVALWASMLMEKSNAGNLGLFGLSGNFFALSFVNTSFKGFACISVLPALLSLFHLRQFEMASLSPTVFGARVPCFLLSLILYVLVGAWFVLMIVRNLKRDRPQIQLLSRWQCVGLGAFCNLLFYAFWDVHSILTTTPHNFRSFRPQMTAYDMATFAVAWNAFFLFLIGIAALSPPEKLKVWWRKWEAGEASYHDANGLPWPWLAPTAAIAYAMLVAEALGLASSVPLGEWRLGFVALMFISFLVFAARDVMFLQWCMLTRMTHPVMKGFLFLLLYYSATGIIGVVANTIAAGSASEVMSFLNPYAMLGDLGKSANAPVIILTTIAGQLGIGGLILVAIQRRLARPVHVAEASAA